ncbi:hypothetical protein [Paludibaculum fermentans]|uniref:hypothetical protein n=1 Tax=Paludibaculum fermentans TaxID=1473598 RepID=UPI003EB989F2
MNARAILNRTQTLRILVAGDLWLDRWSRHDPYLRSTSPETGLESTVVVATETAAGGCGLTAAVVAALGAQVTLLGVTGDDGTALDLRRALELAGVSAAHLITGPGPTAALTRFLNTRSDAEDLGRVEAARFQQPEPVAAEFLAALQAMAPGHDCVIAVEHQPAVLGGLTAGIAGDAWKALAAQCPLLWLETPRQLQQIRADAASPLNVRPDGQGGVEIDDGSARQTVPERVPENPLDPHGARETFSAAAALALAAGAEAPDAVRFALLAAAVCMMKPGARCASPDEILRAEREWSE